jgi:hypothetical protein
MNAIILFCAAAFAMPSLVLAQESQMVSRRSHVGVIASFGLPSDFNDAFDVLFDAESVDVRSRDFEVGLIIRGRHLGGDWGVSYVQKRYDDGSSIGNTADSCFGGQCVLVGSRSVFHDVQLRGIGLHKFAPFVTIKQLAQVGITVGGGVGQVRGTAERRSYGFTFDGAGNAAQDEVVTQIDAAELFLEGTEWIPIWKIEVTGAVLIARGLKLRAGWGLDFTNYPAASVSVAYLIGAR